MQVVIVISCIEIYDILRKTRSNILYYYLIINLYLLFIFIIYYYFHYLLLRGKTRERRRNHGQRCAAFPLPRADGL